jgi:Winged helix DNA-binding domain
MLDFLWKQGAVTVAGRDGLRRLWGLADFPEVADLPREELVTLAAGHALRALGVARARDVERHFTIGRYPGLDLEHAGWARPVRVEGGSEQWWVHRDTLGLLDEQWRPRTTLLSPFDNLICDRGPDRTALGFRLPQRDLRAKAQAALRQLRDAGASGGAADRPGGAADGPQARRRFGSLRGPGGIRRILSTGESAGRSRRAQAR